MSMRYTSACVLLAACTACDGPPGASPPTIVAAAAPAVPTAAVAGLAVAPADDAALGDLRQEVMELRHEVAGLRTQIDRLPGAREAAAATPPDPRLDPAARQEAQQAERLRLAENEAAFQGERSDPRWAPGTTASIQAALGQADASMRDEVRSVECRTRSCRVEIDATPGDTLNQQLPMLLTQLAPTLPHVNAGQVDQGDGRQATVLFLSR